MIFPPSHCPKCENRIKPYDLIPVVSYIILKGRCRFCKEKISIRYPVVEALAGVMGLVCLYRYGLTIEMLLAFLTGCILIYISAVDIDTMEISTKSILLLFAFRIMQVFFEKGFSLKSLLAIFTGSVLSMLLILAIYLFSRGNAMGFGDVLLIAAGGAGFSIGEAILANFLAFIIGAIFSVFILLRGKKELKREIPFGPFISVAIFITILFGEKILQVYTNYLIK